MYGEKEAELIAAACSKALKGRTRCMLRLLENKVVELGIVNCASDWPNDPDRPLVCLDETSKQLLAESCVPIPIKAGRATCLDYEYERDGTANVFMIFARSRPGAMFKVAGRQSAVDYVHVLKDLADIHFPRARTIVLVQYDLNIHSKAPLYEAFPTAEGRRLVERFEWYYAPKHGSWLDLAESERGVLSTRCLDRGIPISKPSSTKSPPGSRSEIPIAPRPTATSQPRRLASNAPVRFDLTESSD